MVWARSIVDRAAWEQATQRLHAEEASLVGLWAEPGFAYMALMQSQACEVLTLACEENRFPSVGRLHPPAIRLERAIRDLVGLEPEGLPDTRPWLRHAGPYPFLSAEGESLHQIPVGPVHAGIIEPGHFRFTANGETVVRLEARLGYVHKGIDALMAGAPIERAAQLAGRVSGDSTVAYRSCIRPGGRGGARRGGSAARGLAAGARGRARAARQPLRRHRRRCNDAAFAMMHAQCGLLREQVLRTADGCFGHRLMMDRVIPGGMRCDLAREGERLAARAGRRCSTRFPELIELYEDTASLKDRTVGTGILSSCARPPVRRRRFSSGVRRAAASMRGARPAMRRTGDCSSRFQRCQAGDVNARIWIRIREVEQSIGLVEQILRGLPPGPIHASPLRKFKQRRGRSCPGRRVSAATSCVGEDRPDGAIDRCHLRDPSWFQWPLLEAAIEGNIVADFPLCNKSFNCSYSGHDL